MQSRVINIEQPTLALNPVQHLGYSHCYPLSLDFSILLKNLPSSLQGTDSLVFTFAPISIIICASISLHILKPIYRCYASSSSRALTINIHLI